MTIQRKIIIISFVIILNFIFGVYKNPVSADTSTPTPTTDPNVTPTPEPSQDNSQQAQDLQDKIQQTQLKINDLQGQEKTLSSQIAVMDNQQKLTEFRIEAT